MQSELATFSRRDLLSLIGAVSGSAAMYHAMTRLGFASNSGYKGPIRARGRSQGALRSSILGAGLAGMTAALELRKAGYKVQFWSSTAARAAATGRCGAAIVHRTRRLHADLRIRAGPLHQSRPVAHSVPPSRDSRLLQAPGGRARAVRPAQSQRASCMRRAFGGMPQRIRDVQAISTAVAELLAKARNRANWTKTYQRGSRDPAARAARWGALDAKYATRRMLISDVAVRPRTGRRPQRRADPCEPLACAICSSRAVAGSSRTFVYDSRPRCSSRSAAWT